MASIVVSASTYMSTRRGIHDIKKSPPLRTNEDIDEFLIELGDELKEILEYAEEDE